MSTRFDVIVIGSGFGGAITARRLAEKGMRVLVLERGRRWEPERLSQETRRRLDLQRQPAGAPQRLDGHALLQAHGRRAGRRSGRRIAELQQRGHGSESRRLHEGMARRDHVRRAEAVLRHGRPGDEPAGRSRRPVDPPLQARPRGRAQSRLHRSILEGRRCPSAFPKTGTTSSRTHSITSTPGSSSTRTVSARGRASIWATATSDATCGRRTAWTSTTFREPSSSGAEVRPLHLVRYIEPQGGKYQVSCSIASRAGGWFAARKSPSASSWRAGSLGTTELLLRCRDQYRTLPALSAMLGTRWSANANFISMGTYSEADRIRQSAGPDHLEPAGFHGRLLQERALRRGRRRLPEPPAQRDQGVLRQRRENAARQASSQRVRRVLRDDSPLRSLMVWLAAGKDAGDGQLLLKRRWFMPWKRVLSLMWEVEHSEGVLNAMNEMHQSLTEATGGRPRVAPDLEPLEESGDAAPAGRRAHGRVVRHGRRRPPRARASATRT